MIERARRLQEQGIFLGGRLSLFETGGRKQLITLLSQGLSPVSRVLDIGCGCLRGGYWFIHFLDPGCYFGIEPNRRMLHAGMDILLEPGLMELKKPRFDYCSNFDFSVFGEKFDFFVASSIWTHASKIQIEIMLDGFLGHSKQGGVFMTSYLKPSLLKGDYKGDRWVGRSHESDVTGFVRHSFSWIRRECGDRGLLAEEIKGKEYNHGRLRWLRIRRKNPDG